LRDLSNTKTHILEFEGFVEERPMMIVVDRNT